MWHFCDVKTTSRVIEPKVIHIVIYPERTKSDIRFYFHTALNDIFTDWNVISATKINWELYFCSEFIILGFTQLEHGRVWEIHPLALPLTVRDNAGTEVYGCLFTQNPSR